MPGVGRAKASPERGGGTANGRDGEVLRGIEFTPSSAIRQLFNLSVGSADSSPFRGAIRKARAVIGVMQTRRAQSGGGMRSSRPTQSRRRSAPCRGGYHPPAKPIAACSKLECHSEDTQCPWNLSDYGAPIACQRKQKNVSP